MTFDDALQLLGIARSDGVDAVRPAYLKLLKKYRPERDPEGFKRLRQALELVQAQPYQFRRSMPPTPPSYESAEPPPVVVAPLVPHDPLATLRTELEAIPDDVDRLQAAEAGALRLGSADAYALWVELAGQDDDSDALQHALRTAIDAGYAERFLPQLRLVAPDALKPAELDAWLLEASSAYDFNWSMLATQLLAQQRAHDACELAMRSLTLMAEAGAELHEWSLLYLAFDLFARADASAAAAFAARLLAARDPYSRVEPVLYAALGELTRYHAELGELLTRGIAAALQAGNPDAASSAFELFKTSEPRRLRPLLKLLERDAPTLHSLYKQELASPAAWWRRPTEVGGWRRLFWPATSWGWGLWCLVSVLRVCGPRACNEADAPPKIEVRSPRAVNGAEFTVCTPPSEPFCQAALRVVREPDCSPAQLDALATLRGEAAKARTRINASTWTWFSTLVTNAERLCSPGGTHP